MARSERLLALLQLLRTHRYPVTAATLAETLCISERTLYRDINSLREQGIDIVGESGMGYVLKTDNTLPPLNFTMDEIQTVVLGLRWINRHGDDELINTSRHVLAKIKAVLPAQQQEILEDSPLMIVSKHAYSQAENHHAKQLRLALNAEYKVHLHYQDANDKLSKRTIYPLAIGFCEHYQFIAAWCELRQEFRHFRIDRIIELYLTSHAYQPNRRFLLKRWHEQHGIPEQ